MGLDQLISFLVAVTLIGMMLATGLSVRPADVTHAVRDGNLVIRAGLANYVAVPLSAVVLLLAVDADPLMAAGILILAVCPGAPYAPPLTALGQGATATSLGLMVILAGSSAVLAPLLLSILLPLTTEGADLHVEPLGLLEAVMVTQLLPLCCGLAISHLRPDWAAQWLAPAVLVSKVLNAATLAAILTLQFPQLLDFRPNGILATLFLLGVSLGAGWSAGGRRNQDRRAVALTILIRNVSLGLVIASNSFAGTPVVTTVLIYGLMQLLTSFLLALLWRRGTSLVAVPRSVRPKSQ